MVDAREAFVAYLNSASFSGSPLDADGYIELPGVITSVQVQREVDQQERRGFSLNGEPTDIYYPVRQTLRLTALCEDREEVDAYMRLTPGGVVKIKFTVADISGRREYRSQGFVTDLKLAQDFGSLYVSLRVEGCE